MAYEQFTVASGPGTGPGEAQPGFLVNNGTLFDNTGFADIGAGLAGLENTANSPSWAPYDRMIQAPTINSGADQPFGVFVWQQDKIFDQNPAGGAWRVVHTVTDQENLLDYGVKTGLIKTIGTDGRPYLVGFYPAAAAGTVGAVKFDVLGEVWTSQTFSVGGKFTNCTYAISLNGQAYMASEGNLYVYDPAGESLVLVPNTAALGSDWRDKVFVLSGRVFLASIASGAMRVYEYFGSFKLASTVAGCAFGAEVEFGVLTTFDSSILAFYSSGRRLQAFQVQTGTTLPMSPLTITDRTAAVWTLGPSNPALSTESRVTARQEYETNPKSEGGGFFVVQDLFAVGVPRYSVPWRTYRWNGPTALATNVATQDGTHTYTSAPKGDGSHIHHGATAVDGTKLQIYGFEDLTGKLGAQNSDGYLLIRFGIFGATGSPATQAVRLLFGTEDDDPGGIASTQGTLISTSQGTLDGFGRLSNVPLTPQSGLQGSDYYTMVWDRLADGVDLTKRHWVKLESKNNSVEFI